MTALALNLLALLIVLGLCWGAMMWLSGRFHGQRRSDQFDVRFWDAASAAAHHQQQETKSGVTDPAAAPAMAPEAPCTVCEGVGAHNSQGRLAPCPQCYGTGVLTQ